MPLDLVPARGHVPGQPPRRHVPALPREEPVHERERPERLARPERRPLAGDGPLGLQAPEAVDAAVGLLLRAEEAGQPAQELVLAPVAGGDAPLGERDRGQCARAQARILTRLGEGDPVVVAEEVLVRGSGRPCSAAASASSSPVCAGEAVEAQHHARVPREVVVGRRRGRPRGRSRTCSGRRAGRRARASRPPRRSPSSPGRASAAGQTSAGTTATRSTSAPSAKTAA